MVEFMQGVHAQVKAQIKKSNAKYEAAIDVHKRRVLFKEGDIVWVILSKGRQSHGHYMKLNDWKMGPCEGLCKINDNSYQVKLPPHLSISYVFTVQHLVPYVLCES